MAKLVLIRHGQSQWNLENRFTGWVDVALTPKGEEEATQAGRSLKQKGFYPAVAFTSNLQRAQKTLDLVLQQLGDTRLPIHRDEALNERHYGDLQGKNKAETAKEFGEEQVHIWRRSFDIAPPKGESLKDTAARTLPYFHSTIVPVLKAGKDVIVAAHGNSLRSIVMDIEKMTPAQILQTEIGTGVAWIYDFDANKNQFTRLEPKG
ncbi:MAG: 2,3-diphosphoglycerate-dependent phosphoglycerate mutase [Bdellovibrionales bacterium]|nr:2,3-diphosphoglycerate-dependent phosphoglycerate mutase [Bdellovibrionales bacterium]